MKAGRRGSGGQHVGDGASDEGEFFAHAGPEVWFGVKDGEADVIDGEEADHAFAGAEGEALFAGGGIQFADQAGGFFEEGAGTVAEMPDLLVIVRGSGALQSGVRCVDEAGAQAVETGDQIHHVLGAQGAIGAEDGAQGQLGWGVDVPEAEVLQGGGLAGSDR